MPLISPFGQFFSSVHVSRVFKTLEWRCENVLPWAWCFMALSCVCVCARGISGPIATGSFVASFFHDVCECVILTLLLNCQHSPLRTCPQHELCALCDGGIMEESQRGMVSSLDALIARRQSQLVWTVAMSLWFVRSVRAWKNQDPVFCCGWKCQMFVFECVTQLN